MKYKIEKDTVQETLLIPLYGKKKCSEIFPNLYYDEFACKIIEDVDYDFSILEKKAKNIMYRFGFLEVAMRQNDLAIEVKDYLKSHPKAAVVNLGCGLDNLGRYVDNGLCKIYNIDFPDVINVRNQLLSAQENEKNIACNLNDTSWFDEIDDSNGVVFFAAGVFYYFLKEEVQTLITKMFDAANKKAVKLMLKTWLKTAQIKNVGAYFAVSNASKDLSNWSKNIKVSSKGYMLGYNNLKDPSVSSFYRFLAKVGDKMMKMQIVRIDFD